MSLSALSARRVEPPQQVAHGTHHTDHGTYHTAHGALHTAHGARYKERHTAHSTRRTALPPAKFMIFMLARANVVSLLESSSAVCSSSMRSTSVWSTLCESRGRIMQGLGVKG